MRGRTMPGTAVPPTVKQDDSSDTFGNISRKGGSETVGEFALDPLISFETSESDANFTYGRQYLRVHERVRCYLSDRYVNDIFARMLRLPRDEAEDVVRRS